MSFSREALKQEIHAWEVFSQKHLLLYLIFSHKALAPEAKQRMLGFLGATQEGMPLRLRQGPWIGPKADIEPPWSVTAAEIFEHMGIPGIMRVIPLREAIPNQGFDSLLEQRYATKNEACHQLGRPSQAQKEQLEPRKVTDLAAENERMHLNLNKEECDLLSSHARALQRDLTEAEVFSWAQIHSEHCRHKHFNARYVAGGVEQAYSLFDWIKATTRAHPNYVVSAYKDNVAFVKGPACLDVFGPTKGDVSSPYAKKQVKGLISLKAETHNFPTTVEPFYGAATGMGGEIRDRMAGGKGSIPLAGAAIYMTPYARIDSHPLLAWEKRIAPRKWLYQHPKDLLIKASDGTSDYANKFGQPLIGGSVLTLEHKDMQTGKVYAYDKVVMLAAGVGVGVAEYAEKGNPQPGDLLVLLGGKNYRIGMGGGAVSSGATGASSGAIERQAIQRANPEMQRRIVDALKALLFAKTNAIVSIHDHGAGGHLNCFAELLDGNGADIWIDALPLGDPTLSYTELLCNESQERMGLIIRPQARPSVERICMRMRCPMAVVGEVNDTKQLRCLDRIHHQIPIDMPLDRFICQLPVHTVPTRALAPVPAREKENKKAEAEAKQTEQVTGQETEDDLYRHTKDVLSLESVACKDWLTNKIDRCVGGRVALQPTCGPLQLPLNNVGVVKGDFFNPHGIALALGHAPGAGLHNPTHASQLSMAEALSNLVFAPLCYGLAGVACSANWMWPKGDEESARLYEAVRALSLYAQALGIAIPTGKDSLSMQQRYAEDQVVAAPGTLVISATAQVEDVQRIVSPVLDEESGAGMVYIPLSCNHALGGSALWQTAQGIESKTPQPLDGKAFKQAFDAVQTLIKEDLVLGGHDVGSGGLIVTLLELCFTQLGMGMDLDFSGLKVPSLLHLLFSEAPAWVLQTRQPAACLESLHKVGVSSYGVGKATKEDKPCLQLRGQKQNLSFDIASYRKQWFARSAALDACKRPPAYAKARALALSKQPLLYHFPTHYNTHWPNQSTTKGVSRDALRPKAAVLREKGVNSEEEIAYGLYRAGFSVTDIHMSDLCKENNLLDDIGLLVFAGGFSHADVFGAAKGWGATIQHNPYAHKSLASFYAREDVLSLGICNGCQLMGVLGLLAPKHLLEAPPPTHPSLAHNESGCYECRFTDLEILDSPSVFFSVLAGCRLGAWVAHGEGRFVLSDTPDTYPVVARYAYADYPSNPNGSDLNAACLCNHDGRHNAIMPHIERAWHPYNWPYYPKEKRLRDTLSPWAESLFAARKWLLAR